MRLHVAKIVSTGSNIILKLADYHYPPVTVDEVYKEVLAQAENFRKYAE